jgi:DhnA family fructose-bisphosphate aldolase class Ia
MANYSLNGYQYNNTEFFPLELYHEITEVRVRTPEVILQEAQNRKRRDTLTRDGNLLILAVDHPGRRVTNIREEPLRMGDRYEYLGRAARVLIGSAFDGIMGTPDFIEDLIILNYLIKQRGGDSFLDDRVLMGCMNRGGLIDTAFEMHDTYTAFTPRQLKEMRMDGGKMLCRLDPESRDAGKTVTETADIISELNEVGIPAILEPLSVERTSDGYRVKKDYATLIRDISFAAALGSTSMRTWLKIPYCENYEQVTRASTLPILMLGGAAGNDPVGVLQEFGDGMSTSPAVRGAMVGRKVSFPYREDPQAIATALVGVIHKNCSVDEAIERLQASRGQDINALHQYV